MKLVNNQKGLTLIEVIIAVTILTIIAVAFIPLFSTSFSNIFAYGDKDLTMAYASDQMEMLYSRQPFSNVDELKNKLSGGQSVDTRDDLYSYNPDYDFNYYIEGVNISDGDTDINGYKVTIVSFYREGDRKVELSSFIRGESNNDD